MDIKSKLARLDKSKPELTVAPLETIRDEDWMREFEYELRASIIQEKNSFIVIKERIYPLQSFPFMSDFKNFQGIIPNFHQLNGSHLVENLDLQRTLFIDLETSGIAGGSGTFAFLVGLGHLEWDHIVVRQYLLPDFQYEWLLLKHVENSFVSFNNLATYNGKSFDIPLLRNRFVLNRMETRIDQLYHIDFLHLARRIWKKRLAGCDLKNLEYVILGQERIHDIPGELIPQIYFEYIRKRKVSLLEQVFEHNFYDVCNMILLAIQIGLIASDPFKYLHHDEDLFSIARYYYRRHLYEAAQPIFQELLNSTQNPQLKVESLFFLSMLYKHRRQYQQSSELFHQLLTTQKDHATAIEELAKYYEHKEKNYQAALELVNKALEHINLLEQLGKESSLLAYKNSLHHRRDRLERRKHSSQPHSANENGD